jgi:hypothetical protein
VLTEAGEHLLGQHDAPGAKGSPTAS